MRSLTVFNFVTLNGFYKGADGDIGWHRHGAEEGEYSAESLQSDNILLFGRVTYEMMASFWPTAMALQTMPVVAEGMNNAEKIVFSRTLAKAEWSNTRVVKGNIVEEIRALKEKPGSNMTILGSGTIVTQFAGAGLIDGYQIMVDPVLLGEGTPMFKGLKEKLDLKLTSTKTFASGVVLLNYEPMK